MPVEGPSEINRADRMRQVTVGANLQGRPLGDVTDDIKQAINAISLPAGYKISMGGDSEPQDDAFGSLG